MRRLSEFVLLFFICGIPVYLIQSARPRILSGTVVDWATRHAVPNAQILFPSHSGSGGLRVIGHADAKRSFSLVIHDPLVGCCALFAAAPGYGTLLQARLGHSYSPHIELGRRSQITLPLIPATAVSGHVFDTAQNPIANRRVTALIRDPEDASKLLYIDSAETDGTGAFSFTQLGSDRYFLAAVCHKYLPGESPMAYGGVGRVPG